MQFQQARGLPHPTVSAGHTPSICAPSVLCSVRSAVRGRLRAARSGHPASRLSCAPSFWLLRRFHGSHAHQTLAGQCAWGTGARSGLPADGAPGAEVRMGAGCVFSLCSLWSCGLDASENFFLSCGLLLFNFYLYHALFFFLPPLGHQLPNCTLAEEKEQGPWQCSPS